MEIKKNPNVDLENKKGIFFQVGLIVALVVVFFAFEYKTYDKTTLDIASRIVDDTPEEIIPITEQKVKPPPPPPPKQVIQIKIVEDDVEVEDDLDIDVEADDETVMDDYVPVEEEEEIGDEVIFQVVEQNPEFPGGMGELYKFLGEKTKYPPIAKESGIQGRVFVNFVVERDGSISNVKVLRGIGGGCDEEAIRVVKSMPKWKPGKQRGKAVRVSFNLPIKFTLQ